MAKEFTMYSDKPFMSVAEVAKMLGMCKHTVWKLLAAKKLPGTKLGGTWVISRKRLVEFIESSIDSRIGHKSTARKKSSKR